MAKHKTGRKSGISIGIPINVVGGGGPREKLRIEDDRVWPCISALYVCFGPVRHLKPELRDLERVRLEVRTQHDAQIVFDRQDISRRERDVRSKIGELRQLQKAIPERRDALVWDREEIEDAERELRVVKQPVWNVGIDLLRSIADQVPRHLRF